jgi:hypothetical protein
MRIPILLILALARAGQAANTTVVFDPARPETGPFPSNVLTVADGAQQTGLRIDMPFPNCQTPANLVACAEILAVNQLDGFPMKPRLRVTFSGPINADTLRQGISIVWLDSAVPVAYPLGSAGKVTPINEVVYDPATNTAYGRPDEILDQSRRYALVVTDAVRDRAGDSVLRPARFAACIDGGASPAGCANVLEELPVIQRAVSGTIVAASVFTTLSATAFLERARRALESTSVDYRRPSAKSVFTAARVRSVTWRRQVRTTGDRFDNFTLPVPGLLLALSGIGRIAFGSFRSPNYLDGQGGFPQVPTGSDVPAPRSTNEIHFHAWLPAQPPPPRGYPVVIAGHAIGDSRFGMPTVLALSFCRQGYAVVAMNAVGHGFGPESSLQIAETDGTVTELEAPGRGRDPGSGIIGEADGFFASGTSALLFGRDTMRQTALDLSQLVRAIRSGIDLDGAGTARLDGNDISYLGQSLGSFYGTIFLATEPGVKAAVLNVGGDSLVKTALLSQTFRPVAVQYLGLRGLLNRGPGDFEANEPLRHEAVRVNDVAGAIEIQNASEILQWIESPGRPGNYAPRLIAATLPGVPAKRILFQYAIGDRTVPNPANTGLALDALAGGRTSILRFDLLRGRLPGLGNNPHTFLTAILEDQLTAAVAATAQSQALLFFADESQLVPDVNDTLRLLFGFAPFQTPDALPEGLNWNP